MKNILELGRTFKTKFATRMSGKQSSFVLNLLCNCFKRARARKWWRCFNNKRRKRERKIRGKCSNTGQHTQTDFPSLDGGSGDGFEDVASRIKKYMRNLKRFSYLGTCSSFSLRSPTHHPTKVPTNLPPLPTYH